MPFPRSFLRPENFTLAFWRIVKSAKSDYKQYYRHIFPSYSLSLSDNIQILLNEIRRGVYEPGIPTIVFHPKKSGVLRPLTLLPFRDLLVYQAIVNVVAVKMRKDHDKFALTRRFGAILGGETSHFFYRSWKKCYSAFNTSVRTSFAAGNIYVADFDLVSCYELIDHGILRSCIADRVGNEDLLDLLFERCLLCWTTNAVGRHLRHGIPQGPDASSFLAECVLFRFDAIQFKDADYFRYIDDIKLMAKDEVPLRRALLKLDLKSKELGLVPQAQKINLGKINDVEQVVKSIPSMVLNKVERGKPGSQAELIKLFRSSLKKEAGEWHIVHETRFKYALGRLNPRRDVLKRISSLLPHRPDLSPTFSTYLKTFGCSKDVADLLLETLKRDPTYDASAADYIAVMDVCEPLTDHKAYRRMVSTVRKRSQENSILIRIAALTFRGKRAGPKDAMRLIESETDPLVRNIVLHSLFGQGEDAPFKISACKSLLQREVEGADEDLARYCGFLLLLDGMANNQVWTPGRTANDSVKLLFKGLGINSRLPLRESALDGFFAKHGIRAGFSWRKALGKDHREAEHRSIRLLQLAIGDPTARVMMLDTFNELLIQSFSSSHPSLQESYAKAAGKNPHPDYGNWLHNGTFASFMGASAADLQAIHNARVKADLAHYKSKRGKATKPVSFAEAKRLMNITRHPWKHLIAEWFKILQTRKGDRSRFRRKRET